MKELCLCFRTLGPTVGGSVFAWSIAHGRHIGFPFDVNLIFIIFALVFLASSILSVFMPKSLENQKKPQRPKSWRQSQRNSRIFYKLTELRRWLKMDLVVFWSTSRRTFKVLQDIPRIEYCIEYWIRSLHTCSRTCILRPPANNRQNWWH